MQSIVPASLLSIKEDFRTVLTSIRTIVNRRTFVKIIDKAYCSAHMTISCKINHHDFKQLLTAQTAKEEGIHTYTDTVFNEAGAPRDVKSSRGLLSCRVAAVHDPQTLI